ncbi:hypothetical protein B0H13DRAFT_1914938 [Mycena leptocephala]|nr:hypothetical protein B0H13DRAFT_1914938 [Mycena leptocephala]
MEERGLERQRKFDGLRRWKPDVVMQMFPLLLQLLSLLLFAAELAIYLWAIHRAIAGIVLGLTTLGFTFAWPMLLSRASMAVTCMRVWVMGRLSMPKPSVPEMVIDTPQRTFDLWTFEPTVLRNATDDLRTIISFFRLSRPLRSEEVAMEQERVHDIMTQRALRFTAAQDLPEQHLKAILLSIGYILSLLFENLAKRFERPWDVQIADDILTKLAQFSQTARFRLPMTAMISVLQFVKVEEWYFLGIRSENQDVEWVYATLEWLHDVQRPVLRLIGYLLLVLFICRLIHGKPSAASFRMILSSFPVPSSPGPIHSAHESEGLPWFSDDKLGPILEEDLCGPALHEAVPRITVSWVKNCEDLPGWLAQYPTPNNGEEAIRFLIVLSRVWDADAAEANRFLDSPQHIAHVKTAGVYGVDGVLFAARVSCSESVPGVKATIMVRLGDAVARAGERAKPDISLNFVEQDSEADVLNGVAEFLSRFAVTINGELANLQQLEEAGTDEYEHWNGLRDTWLAEVDLLKGALENLSPRTAEEGIREDGIIPATLRLK